MGQKVSSERSSRTFPFIEPILSRAAARSITVTPKRSSSSRSSCNSSRRSSHRDLKRSHRKSSTKSKRHLTASGLQSECPHRLDVLLDMPPVDVETQKKHGWNPEDRSPNVFIKDDLIVHRHPVAQSTDAARGKMGYSRGIHCWEITWDTRQRGTHAMVGVCTKEAALTCQGYRSLVGQNQESYGWDLGRNKLFHGGKVLKGDKRTYPMFLNNDENFIVPEKVIVVLDMDDGTLSFVADKQYLGVAFTGLKGKTLYPIVSCVWGHCEIGIRYINGLEPVPRPLAELCRRRVRMSLGSDNLHNVDKLPLPVPLKNFVVYR